MANHDLVLSALEMNPGSVLPDPSECFFVFDEGHALAHKIVQHYAERHPVRATYGWAGEVPDVMQTVVHALRLDAAMHPRAQAACAKKSSVTACKPSARKTATTRSIR